MKKKKGPESFWESMRRGLKFYENGGIDKYQVYAKRSARIRSIKLMHLHGGGYINSIWPNSGFLLGIAAATKEKFGCKLVATGIGLRPLPAPPPEYKADFKKVIEAFDLFECRDRQSNQFIQKHVGPALNVFSGLDDTFLDPVNTAPGDDLPRSLHLSFFRRAMPSLEPIVSELPRSFVADFDQVLFWQCAPKDEECLEVVKRYLPQTVAISVRDLVFEPLPIGAEDFMITARFHPHLFAARAGAKGTFRPDSGYYNVKHGSIVELGSSFEPIDTFRSSEMRKAVSFNRIVELDQERVSIKRKVASKISKLYEEA